MNFIFSSRPIFTGNSLFVHVTTRHPRQQHTFSYILHRERLLRRCEGRIRKRKIERQGWNGNSQKGFSKLERRPRFGMHKNRAGWVFSRCLFSVFHGQFWQISPKRKKKKKLTKGRSPHWAAATFSGKVSFHCLKLLATDLNRHEFTEEFQKIALI